MAASSRAQVLDLYRAMLRESKHFSAYNYSLRLIESVNAKPEEREGQLSLLPVDFKVQVTSVGQITESGDLRTYAVRRIRDAFRENKNVKDPVEIQALVNKAKRDLGIIRRQVHIGQLYSTDKLVIENQEKPRT